MSEAAATDSAAPRVSTAAGLMAGCATIFGLTALGCIGLGSGALGSALEQIGRQQEDQLEDVRVSQERAEEVDGLLDELAEWLSATRDRTGGFPRALPESPPADPWGTPILYEGGGPDFAKVRSAGPDREHETPDDIVRTLAPGGPR